MSKSFVLECVWKRLSAKYTAKFPCIRKKLPVAGPVGDLRSQKNTSRDITSEQ